MRAFWGRGRRFQTWRKYKERRKSTGRRVKWQKCVVENFSDKKKK